MRTIKRHSRTLNKGKWKTIVAIAEAYTSEKDKWLCELSCAENTDKLRSDRIQRDILVKQKYASGYGLQARQWKMALKDSVETLDKNWKALFTVLRPVVMKNSNLSESQRHYCFWVLGSYERLKEVLLHQYPVPDFSLADADRHKTANYLNRIIRRYKGKAPRVRKARSFCIDANMYSIVEKNDAQYIEVMTLQKGSRVMIALLGKGKISGNLRIVLDSEKQAIELHETAEVCQRWTAKADTAEALDFGYTEAFTTSDGKHYGEGLGKILSGFSDKLNQTGKARNKLHTLEKKYGEEGKLHKSNNIRKYNLGYQKKDKTRRKAQTSLSCMVNNGFNSLYTEKAPAVLVTENLRHVFTFNTPKGVNRKLSAWIRGIIQDRAEFKALEGRSLHKQVNPAYGSQLCPECGFVWFKNRTGDTFKCAFCGHADHSDKVAATNYLRRSSDADITLYVPYSRVKELLMERFLRRLECDGVITLPSGLKPETAAYIMKEWDSFIVRLAKNASERTVAGRTPGTGLPRSSDTVEDKRRIAGGSNHAANTAPVNRRAKLPHPEAKPLSDVA